MKIIILILLACPFALFAQPVLNSCGSGLPIGDFYSGRQHPCDTNGLPPVQVGANVTWDYSALQSPNFSYAVVSFLAAANTPAATSYPNATVAETRGSGDYAYYDFTASAANYHGYDLGANCDIYNDPSMYFPCPLNYGGTFTDTYGGVNCAGVPFSGKRHGEYAGYGTLILPHMTISNAILLHTRDTVVQSGTTTYNDMYSWYDGIENGVRLTVVRYGSSAAPGMTLAVSYFEIIGFLGSEEEALGAAIHVYPSPVHSSLQVDVPAKVGLANFAVHDLSGKLVLESPIRAGQAPITLPDLPPGIYLYHVRNQQGQPLMSGKLVKE